jgi:hypothetical protein
VNACIEEHMEDKVATNIDDTSTSIVAATQEQVRLTDASGGSKGVRVV